MPGFEVPIYLIRIPMLSEVRDAVRLADGSLNSEVDVVKALSQEAEVLGKTHKVILMVDVGDLREGLTPVDKSMEILGVSSDHLLIDVTKCVDIRVGNIIGFDMSYGAMLSLMTSKYIDKITIS